MYCAFSSDRVKAVEAMTSLFILFASVIYANVTTPCFSWTKRFSERNRCLPSLSDRGWPEQGLWVFGLSGLVEGCSRILRGAQVCLAQVCLVAITSEVVKMERTVVVLCVVSVVWKFHRLMTYGWCCHTVSLCCTLVISKVCTLAS